MSDNVKSMASLCHVNLFKLVSIIGFDYARVGNIACVCVWFLIQYTNSVLIYVIIVKVKITVSQTMEFL